MRKIAKSEKDIKTAVTHASLRQMAGGRSYERGVGYFEDGLVGSIAIDGNEAMAKVEGTRTYRVRLWADGEGVDGECTCPAYADSGFCKHCVAVGLSLIETAKEDASDKTQQKPGRKKKKTKTVTMDDLRAHLKEMQKDDLVEIIIGQAMNDERLRLRLILNREKKAASGSVDLDSFRGIIDSAVQTGRYVDYYDVHDYCSCIDEAVDSLDELLKDGHAEEVIELAEYALAAVERALQNVDDSNGYLGGILEKIQELHLAACKKAKPDPEQIARRLFEWEMRTEWDTFHYAVDTYAAVLGKKGIETYKQLAGERWSKVSALKPGENNSDRYGNNYRITSIMEKIAEKSGDVEAQVEVKKRDLSHAYSYLQIAELYRKHKKYDKALEWAEAGLAAFPKNADSRLREFLADEYHREKRHDEAMNLVWMNFSERPCLSNYQILKSHADKSGLWPQWREKALAFIREDIAKSKNSRPHFYWRQADHSLLVEIFLWEKKNEDAWVEAQAGGCDMNLWFKLAALREKDHPEDAANVYSAQLYAIVNQKNNDAYKQGVNLIKKIGVLMKGAGKEKEFKAYLEQVRITHKPKRNFMKLLQSVT
ncbi:MAG TPA: SWIM zinc finger family protein [bacterium]|mgnify:CR=1 FL=1|nr:SWIM zinc finger family protein [bacterium]